MSMSPYIRHSDQLLALFFRFECQVHVSRSAINSVLRVFCFYVSQLEYTVAYIFARHVKNPCVSGTSLLAKVQRDKFIHRKVDINKFAAVGRFKVKWVGAIEIASGHGKAQ